MFPTTKQMKLYIRQHPFFLQKNIVPFQTSDRRAFERDVYDHARALNISRKNAKKQVIKAREFCGEEKYDSSDSALEGEINGSSKVTKGRSQVAESPLDTLRRLGGLGELNGTVIPSIEDQDGPPAASNADSNAPMYLKKDAERRATLELENTEKNSEKRARKKARREERKQKAAEQERKNRDQSHSPPARSSAPETEQIAHENYVKSSKADLEKPRHVDGSRRERTEKDLLKQVQGLRDFSNTKQVERFENGGMKGASKEMKNDIKEKKEDRDYLQSASKEMKNDIEETKEDRDYLQGDKRGTSQKRKSEAQPDAVTTKKSKRDKSHRAKSVAGDFHHPMI